MEHSRGSTSFCSQRSSFPFSGDMASDKCDRTDLENPCTEEEKASMLLQLRFEPKRIPETADRTVPAEAAKSAEKDSSSGDADGHATAEETTAPAAQETTKIPAVAHLHAAVPLDDTEERHQLDPSRFSWICRKYCDAFPHVKKSITKQEHEQRLWTMQQEIEEGGEGLCPAVRKLERVSIRRRDICESEFEKKLWETYTDPLQSMLMVGLIR